MRAQALLIVVLPVLAIALIFAISFLSNIDEISSFYSVQNTYSEFDYVSNAICSMQFLNPAIFDVINAYFQAYIPNFYTNGTLVTYQEGTNMYFVKKC